MIVMRLQKILIIWLLVTISGCAQNQSRLNQLHPEYYYDLGIDSVKQGNFNAAIDAFGKQMNLYPDSPVTEKATLQLIYSYYKQKRLNDAISAADSFINKYPLSKKLDYAYYSKGLALFELGIGAVPLSDDSDTSLRRAYDYFTEFVKKFPDSKYADDSRERLTFLYDKLAMKEVEKARAALNNGQYGTAVINAKYVLENYKGTDAAVEALNILTQSYNLLGIGSESDSLELINGSVAQGIEVDNQQYSVSSVSEVIPDLEIDGVGWRNARWFYSQSSDAYTLQLLMTRSENGVVNLIDKYLEFLADDYAYYPVRRKGEIWYGLVYGSFATISAAEAAIESLPAGLMESRPWIRKMGTLQDIAEKEVY